MQFLSGHWAGDPDISEWFLFCVCCGDFRVLFLDHSVLTFDCLIPACRREVPSFPILHPDLTVNGFIMTNPKFKEGSEEDHLAIWEVAFTASGPD